MISDLLFDVSWWIPALLGVIGATLFWTANNRQQAGPRRAGLGLIALAIAWAALSYFVDTDKEKAIRATKTLVADVVSGNWSDFRSKLTPDCRFSIEGGEARAQGDAEMTDYAKAGAESVRLRSATVQNVEAHETGTYITVSTNLFSTQELPGAPAMRSSFDFDWQQTSKGWAVREIRLIKIGDVDQRQLERDVPKGKAR